MKKAKKFSELTEKEKLERLREGARKFAEDFAEVFEELSKE